MEARYVIVGRNPALADGCDGSKCRCCIEVMPRCYDSREEATAIAQRRQEANPEACYQVVEWSCYSGVSMVGEWKAAHEQWDKIRGWVPDEKLAMVVAEIALS